MVTRIAEFVTAFGVECANQTAIARDSSAAGAEKTV
jgi:hypothetical protein